MSRLNQRPDPNMDREHLIKELDELRALTDGFLGTVPGAFIVLDSKGRLVYLNDQAKKLFEGDTVSLIDRPFEEIYPKILGPIFSPRIIREALERKEKTVNKYSNHLRKWFQISAYSSDFGIFIRLEDITSEMLLNRLLRLNEFSVSRAKDMIFWVKMGGHIIYANKAMCDSLGYRREQIANMKMTDIDPSFTLNKWAGFVHEMKESGFRTYESSLRARDGSGIPVEVTWSYLEYHGDEYLMAFARNIAERKKAEKSLMEAKAEAELYVDLMGHDINNMNQIATGFLELALDMVRTEGKIDDTQIDLIAKPLEMLLNSSRLIENVRKAQRERAGQFKPKVVGLGKVLEEVKNSYSHVPDRDVTITYNRDGECRVAANELLKDIFLNIVGNSIKHSKGPLTIGIDMARIAENGRAHCQVAVEDDGPGISDEMKKKLLDRLSPENARARGKGFGLYLIKQLVDDFHGRFWMEDRVQGDHTQGARFVVRLPVIED